MLGGEGGDRIPPAKSPLIFKNVSTTPIDLQSVEKNFQEINNLCCLCTPHIKGFT